MWDIEVDLLVVGSGGGGMTAALVGKQAGLDVLVLEKTPYYGGSTARSGGGLWIPNNYLLAIDGIEDSFEKARLYMQHTVGDKVPQPMQDMYLLHAPRMIEWLRDHTSVQFQRMPGYSDYYPEHPGGMAEGRSLEPVPFNRNLLKNDKLYLRKPMAEVPFGFPISSSDYQKLGMVVSTWAGKRTALKATVKWIKDRLTGVYTLTMGQALSARLRYALKQADIPLWLSVSFKELILEDARVIGALVERDGQRLRIASKRGVVLAAGGFALNLDMREKYLPRPTSLAWTVASPGNTGDAIRAAQDVGAVTDLMSDAWWGPSSVRPGEDPFFHVGERAYPGAIMVNGQGQRFVNESAPYIDVVNRMYELHTDETSNIPAYFIFDRHYRTHYLFGMVFPILPIPSRYLKNQYIKRANTIWELAEIINISPEALENTIERFNVFARQGRDLDFNRGESAYDRYYGDPTRKPNSNLAPLHTPPYYAVELWPGDLGTKGGLVTDPWARVLRQDESTIEGLYATGNTMASVMGNSYPGAGATIGPAMTFGYIAANHAAGNELSLESK